MTKFTLIMLAALGMQLVMAEDADASCRWEWVCDERQNCQQVPICDSSIGVVPPRPPSVKPIVPPAIRPPAVRPIPPVGTGNCRQARICDAIGNCYWDWVCR